MDFKPSQTGVFINYRRVPDLATAGRLFDTLSILLPGTNIFVDVDSLPLGRDFVAELGARIARCDLFLSIISQGWLNATDETGARLIDRSEDFVRFEIETALRFGKQIIPVLIGDAKMPAASEFPASISAVATLNAMSVRHEKFSKDCQLLAEKIRPALTSASTYTQSAIADIDAFKFETTQARRLVAERPPGWEYLLIAELWGEYLKVPLRRLSDLSGGLYSIRRVPITDDHVSLTWIREQFGAAAGMIESLQKLMTIELPRAWCDPGVPGDPREILHVCKLMQRAAHVIVEWEEVVRSYEVTDTLKRVHDLLPGIAARQLDKVKDLPAFLISAVERALANPGESHEVHFQAVFDFPDGWEKKIECEVRRLQSG